MKSDTRKDLWLHAILILIAAMTLLPFAFVLNNSFRTNTELNHSFFGFPKKLDIEGYRYAWSVLRPYVLNTLLVCAATVFSVISIGSISAYVFSRYRFPGHKVLFLIVLSFMMIPGILTL